MVERLNGKFVSFGRHACLVWEMKQGSFNVVWVHLMNIKCYPTLGPHLDQVPKGPHCWVKQGPTLGTQKYFGF